MSKKTNYDTVCIIEITDGWTLSFKHPQTGENHLIPAEVPGNFALDLAHAGLIKESEIMPPDTDAPLREWEKVDEWVYQTEFDVPEIKADESLELCFQGIDTIADIFLNGEYIGHSDNMFISHSFILYGKVKPQRNQLEIRIANPIRQADMMEHDELALWTSADSFPSYVRKIRCLQGWDNAPRLLTGGIFRPVELHIKPACRVEDIYLYTRSITPEAALIGIHLELTFPEELRHKLTGKIAMSWQGEEVLTHEFLVNQRHFTFHDFEIANPHLWWPRGYGKANLYNFTVELLQGERKLARKEIVMGIRTIRLERTEIIDKDGKGDFAFICNNERIFCRGTNWKPLDALLCRITPERTKQALQLAIDCNCNMLRIWGGGVYEEHDFYDFCDANGLLVWQDFMMACEFPPQTEEFRRIMENEAAFIVKKLRNHPSIALWCGDNEVDKGFFRKVCIPHAVLPSDNRITREVLRNTVMSCDPFRSYIASSPYINDDIVREKKDWREVVPQLHLYVDYAEFFNSVRRFPARFLGEVGPSLYCPISESPTLIELERSRLNRLWGSMPSGDTPRGSGHQTDHYFATWQKVARRVVKAHFNRDFQLKEFDSFALALNLICASVYKHSIEYYRMDKPVRTGVLWWSLLDMWPMMFNYSVVDAALKPKLPYYWIRQSQQPVCMLMTQSSVADGFRLNIVNDTLEAFTAIPCCVLRFDEKTNKLMTIWEKTVDVPANSSVELTSNLHDNVGGLMLLEWTLNGKVLRNHFIADAAPYDFETFRQWHEFLRQYLNF